MRLRNRLTGMALFLAGSALLVSATGAGGLGADGPKPLNVLFLGDNAGHRPAERFEQLGPVMAGRGINLTYTDRVSDLNPQTLSQYDALVIYANTTSISPEQEKALLDYVNNGGGFVPLHCASYCFLNSPAYIDLVGAQFLKHGVGQFETTVTAPDHPIIRGLEPFRTWDETYVHARHNPRDRQVLQTRDDQDGSEPWTWTRTQGKGRVFYTAYGHDARTWGNPGFHDLVERGIRWAANRGEVFDSRPRVTEGLRPFEYEKAEIPLYTPGAKWGTLGEPIRRMQKPLTPEESFRHLALPKGFEAQLFAAEPEIYKPITMTWDHQGRLYIAETIDYPNEIQPRGEGRDRITIVEDTNGDGRADRFSIFAEKLSIPTSMCFVNGGLVVSQAPDMLFLKDTDGDGKADERKVLFTGFRTNDTHAGPSNLRYGLDNWIYAIIGYAGFEGTVGGERMSFRQGFFRFRPDGSKAEFLRSTNNNSWGVGISEEGHLFGSTANGCPSVYMPIANRYYESVRGSAPAVLANIADSNRFFPITENVRQVDWHGGFTAGAGSALYTARTFPSYYWNRTAFVAEPTGHLVATFTLHPDGSDFHSHNAWNLVASDDEWTAPILAEVGPDGQVWMIDWYNFIVQHNPTPEGYKTGKGSAYETPLRDKTHGRIYRIVAREGRPSEQPRLSADDPAGLIAALGNDNMFWRLHAQRLLVERGDAGVVDPLLPLIEGPVDAIGLNPAGIHAIWVLHGLGALRPVDAGGNANAIAAVAKGLSHASPGLRRAAIQALPRQPAAALGEWVKLAGADPDAQVRLAAYLAISEATGDDEPTVASLVSALADPRNQRDRWMGDALTIAAAAHAPAFLAALARGGQTGDEGELLVPVTARVAEHYARGGPVDSLASILALQPAMRPRLRDALIGGLAKGWPRDRHPRLDASSEQLVAGLLPELSTEARAQLLGLASRWDMKGLEPQITALASELAAAAADESKPDKDRIDAARQLVEFRPNDAGAARQVVGLIQARTSPEMAASLIAAVARSEARETGQALVDAMAPMTPAARRASILALLSKSDWTAALVGAIEEGKVSLQLLSLDQTQALAAHPDRALAERARALLARGGGLPDPDREKVIQSLAPLVLKGGNASRGKAIYQRECSKCHTHSGEGGKVGPDLTGMAAHPRGELLIHILDPSRSVEGTYTQYTVSTVDGRILNGLLASETKTSIDLLDAEGKKQTILREDIDEIAASKKSVMPEGFEKTVPAEGIADLLQFLTQKGKYLPLDLHKVAALTTTRSMMAENGPEKLVFEDWGPKVVEGVPFLLVDPQGDTVPNAIMLSGGFGRMTARLPRSVELPVNTAARAIHMLSGVSMFGFPGGREGSVTMIARIKYDDGSTEDHELQNGVHFADFNSTREVPGSKLAYKLGGQQIRYLTIVPKKKDQIATIELLKGDDRSAPIVMAITVENFE